MRSSCGRDNLPFRTDARGSSDPDGDSLLFYWFIYPEAGSYRGTIAFGGAENLPRVGMVAPEVTQPEATHVVLRLVDKGSPALTRYRRVVMTVLPEERPFRGRR